jgi:ribose transport system substrate-binding protein
MFRVQHGFSLCLLLVSYFFVGCNTSAPPDGKTTTTPKTETKTTEKTASSQGKKIVFLTNGDDPFWDTCNAGFKEAAEKYDLAAAGLEAEFHKGNGTLEGQLSKLRQYGQEGDVAGVAISVINAENKGLAIEMEKLREQGIHVIAVDSDINTKKYPKARSHYLGTDNLVGGKALGTSAKTLLKEKGIEEGSYVQFAGFRDVDNARLRMDGFKQAIGESFKEQDRMPDEMKGEVAHSNVRNAIDNFQNEKLIGFAGIWAYNTPAIVNVLKERKVRDKYMVFCFDAAKDSIREMGEGNVDVMVVQNPFEMGQQSIRLLKALITKDETTAKEMFPKAASEPGHDIFITGLRVVVPNKDKSPIKADMFDPKLVELMDLKTFTDWLAKYKLVSS